MDWGGVYIKYIMTL